MTLDQLMAFTVIGDHERQEQVFERLQASPTTSSPIVIRRMLTEGAVRASDKRAQFVGLDAYVAAGGVVLRDLFQGDDGGWLQDVALLDRLVAEKLQARGRGDPRRRLEVDRGRARLPLRPHLRPAPASRRASRRSPTRKQATRDALRPSSTDCEADYAEADELPDEVDERLGEIETALARFDERPMVFEPERDRARRRLRQHRRDRATCASSAAMSGPRTNCRSSRSRRRRGRDGVRRWPVAPMTTSATITVTATRHRPSPRRTKA